MRIVQKIPDSEEAKARARLLTHFIDNPERVFYSRQLEILFEDEFFHWVTNRALRSLIEEKHVLVAEEANSYRGVEWTSTGHDLDFVFEKDGRGYGIEVKNTLGYMDVDEFVAKIRLARHIGVTPVFAVRYLPRTWTEALVRAGGYAMIMKYQFYPWTHAELAESIRAKLMLPVDTPKKIEQGTMDRMEKWIANPPPVATTEAPKVEAMLAKIEMANKPKMV